MNDPITNEFASRVQYSQRGGVNFGDGDTLTTGEQPLILDVANAGTITLHIDRMHKGNQVHIFYENITVEDPGEAGQMIMVGTNTSVARRRRVLQI